MEMMDLPPRPTIRTRTTVSLLICFIIVTAVIMITILKAYLIHDGGMSRRQFTRADFEHSIPSRFQFSDVLVAIGLVVTCAILIFMVLLWTINVITCEWCSSCFSNNRNNRNHNNNSFGMDSISYTPRLDPLPPPGPSLPPRIPRAFTRKNLCRLPHRRGSRSYPVPRYSPEHTASNSNARNTFTGEPMPVLGYVYPPSDEHHPQPPSEPGCSYIFNERLMSRMSRGYTESPTMVFTDETSFHTRNPIPIAVPDAPLPIPSAETIEIEVKIEKQEQNDVEIIVIEDLDEIKLADSDFDMKKKEKFEGDIPEALIIEEIEPQPCCTYTYYDINKMVRHETHFGDEDSEEVIYDAVMIPPPPLDTQTDINKDQERRNSV